LIVNSALLVHKAYEAFSGYGRASSNPAAEFDNNDDRTNMTDVDNDMLKFALEWAPYGGGHEHILPTFGLTVDEFYRRLYTLLNSIAGLSIDTVAHQKLREQFMRRLVSPKYSHPLRFGPPVEAQDRPTARSRRKQGH
jgi:hypothetical protein